MAACQQCAAENSDRAKFCSECGAPLPVAVAEQRERRVVSTLFADLAGFTRRSEGLDVEDVEGFLDPYFAVLREEVERTGGTVAKFTGDGVMALFGALVAHEDDPERAVRCGLGICERVSDLAGDLHVRVGITTGEAIVTLPADGHPDAIGDVVNTAARLEAAAPTDGVLVDAWTYHATSRAIDYQEHEPIAAKGKAEPVAVWVAQAPRSIIPEQQRDQLPIVGRDAESDALRSAFERSRGDPSTQLVSIIGEPGIGKTRLVEALYAHVAELPELIIWRRGRSLAYGDGIAFWALGEMVKAQAGILESDSADVARCKLAQAVESLGLEEHDGDWVLRHLGPLVGLEAAAGGTDGSRVEAFAAWRRFLEALAEDGPTVLVFEDIHWADDALLDFIDLLAERGGSVPLLIVCTARPELLERRSGWAGGKTNAQSISLTPLSGEDTARLVGELLDQTLLPAEVQQPLLARAGGNPLYAQEYVRMLQDRSVLIRDEAGWTLDGDVADAPVSIQGIIAARLDTLSADEKSLLQDAAVIGRTAWIGAVCALTERNVWEADEVLHGLERKQLLQRVRRSSMQGEVEFQFGHALTREVAYSQIRRADRAQKHEAAAEWIDQRAGERDDKAELLADHYTQALALRGAMGEDTTPLAPKALAAYIHAGDQAAATYAYPAAARHLQAALTLAPPNATALRATLLLGQATALHNADMADQETLDAALRAQVTVERWEAAAAVERMLSEWCQNHAPSRDEQDAHLARGAEYAARVAPSTTMCHIAADQAFFLNVSGHAEEALALTGGMIPLAEQAGLEVGRAILLLWHGYARVALGDLDGVADMRDAAEKLAENVHQKTAMAYHNLADAERGLGDMPAADAAYTTAASWASRLALTYYADGAAAERAYQAYHAADWNAACDLLTHVQVTTNQFVENLARIVRGRVNLARDHPHDALRDASSLIGFGTSTGINEPLYQGLALEARCHGSLGNESAALDTCDRFLTRWGDTGGMTGHSLELGEIATILAQADRHDDIRQATLLLPDACRWREPLLLIADQRYAEAAELYEQLGSHPLAADAHLLAARQAAAVGATTDAAAHANAVLAFAEQTSATLYQHRAQHLTVASA